MFVLFDTMNRQIVSKHRTIDAAAQADIKLQNAVSRRSQGSYVATALRKLVKGEIVSATTEEIDEYQERKTWHP